MKMNTEISRKLDTVEQFLKENQISRNSFYREVNEGRLRVVKVGRRTYVRPEDGERWRESLAGVA